MKKLFYFVNKAVLQDEKIMYNRCMMFGTDWEVIMWKSYLH